MDFMMSFSNVDFAQVKPHSGGHYSLLQMGMLSPVGW